ASARCRARGESGSRRLRSRRAARAPRAGRRAFARRPGRSRLPRSAPRAAAGLPCETAGWGASALRFPVGRSPAAPFAAAGLAVGLGVLARGLLLDRARRRGRTFLRLGGARCGVETELLHAGGEMLGQLGSNVDRAAAAVLVLRRVDDQAAGVEVHLAADRAGQERL